MVHSRQKILDYIIEQQSTTVEELSKVFHVTEANIRHHLAILTEQGSVRVIGQKTNSTRGRPAQIFSSKQNSEQHNLNRLSNALLSSLLTITGSDDYERILDQIAIHMASEFNPSSI